MQFTQAFEHLKGVPFLRPDQSRRIYDFILAKKPHNILELGFAHGATTCYMAAALDELGRGQIDAVDIEQGRAWQDPVASIEDLAARTGLEQYINIHREPCSYTWFLHDKISSRTANGNCEPYYDFVFIDGAKNWEVDGAAFFMADKLLRPQGWILFDDYAWTYSQESEEAKRLFAETGIFVDRMSSGQANTPNVEEIVRLLVLQHPDYGEVELEGDNWAWVHKVRSPKKTISIRQTRSLEDRALSMAREIKATLRQRLGR